MSFSMYGWKTGWSSGSCLEEGEFLIVPRGVRLSLVAEQAGQVVGHILFSDLPILTDAATVPALALALMAVLPAFQKQGIGSAQVRKGLEECRQQGHKILVVVGHPNFYPRFGFSPALAGHLKSPFSGKDELAELHGRRAASGRGRAQPDPVDGGVLVARQEA
jgi:putative acetyltransferase